MTKLADKGPALRQVPKIGIEEGYDVFPLNGLIDKAHDVFMLTKHTPLAGVQPAQGLSVESDSVVEVRSRGLKGCLDLGGHEVKLVSQNEFENALHHFITLFAAQRESIYVRECCFD